MRRLTDTHSTSVLTNERGTVWHPQATTGVGRVSESTIGTTAANELNEPTSAQQGAQKSIEPPRALMWTQPGANSVPLQIWEGTVLGVDREAGLMRVQMSAKMGNEPRHQADIALEWVSEQDADLVRAGAVFYLTLFKRTKRGSVENSQELRFRRRPSWSPGQLDHIRNEAAKIIAKMKTLPRAE